MFRDEPMDAQQVIDKILTEARAEAEKIHAEAQAQADADRQALQAELEAYEAETQRLAQQAAEEKRARMLAAARMDNRKQELAAKVELLNAVYEKALEQLAGLREEEYCEYMAALMAQAVETGDEKVIVGRQDNRLDDRIVKAVNRRLGPGFKGNLQLAPERADIRGGFILSRGNVRTNVSLEVLVEQAREATEFEVAAILFGDAGKTDAANPPAPTSGEASAEPSTGSDPQQPQEQG